MCVWVSSQFQWILCFPYHQKHVYYVNYQCPWPWHWLTSGSGPIHADTGEMQRSYFTVDCKDPIDQYILFYIYRLPFKIILLFPLSSCDVSQLLHVFPPPLAFKCFGFKRLLIICPCVLHVNTQCFDPCRSFLTSGLYPCLTFNPGPETIWPLLQR